MTAMPEKFSCAKSDRSENACWRSSHRLVMTWLMTVPRTNMTAAGISARSVNLQSIRHILTSAIMPSTAASKNIKMPSPKHS